LKSIQLGSKHVGDCNPCYFIAEIGGLFKNFEEAKRLIDSAVEIGVDAIKFQTLEAETITTKNNFFNLGVTGHISQYDFFKQFEPSKEVQIQIVKYANDIGITVFSAPSHIKDIGFMKKMELSVYKIGSDLACHIPLLKEVAQLGKPIILSTGMCTLEEIKDSVNAILETGNSQLVLLHCVSDYPAKIEESNLKAIQTMKKEFQLPVGYSDHTVGIDVPFAAVIMGANVIEKHFRHPNNSTNADDIHALIPSQFGDLIQRVRQIELAQGNGEKIPTSSEEKNLIENRVSIVSLVDIPAGTRIKKEMIDIRRPGTGLAPKFYDRLINKVTKIDIKSETPLSWNMIKE
jgi:N,N'-diacetyllegionaminate synthase